MPAWTLRIVFPLSLQRVVPDYERAAHEELESQLDAQTLNDLQWYFFHCRRRTQWSEYKGPGDAVKARFTRCTKAFAGPRFTGLYRRWLGEGDAALAPISTAVSAAWVSGRGALDLHLLTHTYEHLAHLVSHQRTRRRRVTADAEEGDKRRRSVNPVLNPTP